MSNFYDNFANLRPKKKKKGNFFDSVLQKNTTNKQEMEIEEKNTNNKKKNELISKFINNLKNSKKESISLKKRILNISNKSKDLLLAIKKFPKILSKNFLNEEKLKFFIEEINLSKKQIEKIIDKKKIIIFESKYYINIFLDFLRSINYFLKLFFLNFSNPENEKKNFFQFLINSKNSFFLNKYFIQIFKIIKFNKLFYFTYNSKILQTIENQNEKENKLLKIILKTIKKNDIKKNNFQIFQNFLENVIDEDFVKNYFKDKEDKKKNLFNNFIEILGLLKNVENSIIFFWKKNDYFEKINNLIFLSLFQKTQILEYFFQKLQNENFESFFLINSFENYINNKKYENTFVNINIIYFCIILLSLKTFEFEKFLKKNINFYKNLSIFFRNNFQFDIFSSSIYKEKIIYRNLLNKIFEENNILSIIQKQKNNTFKLSKNIMRSLLSSFFYNFSKSNNKTFFFYNISKIVKNQNIINSLKDEISDQIENNINLIENPFSFILLNSIINTKKIVEEDLSILKLFSDFKIFSKNLFFFLKQIVEFYGDIFYKKKNLFEKFIFIEISEILNFLSKINEISNFFKSDHIYKNQNLNFLNFEFLQNFYYLFPVEARFEYFKKNRTPFDIPENFEPSHNVVIRKKYILEDGIELYKNLLLHSQNPKKKIKITFLDEFGKYEAGIDEGGLYKDFLTEFTKEIFNPNYGYFMELKSSNELYINPSSEFWIEGDKNLIFQIIGLIIARCFYEGFTLDTIISRTFIRKIKGLPNFFKELKYFDKDLYLNLRKLKDFEDVESLDIFFVVNEKDSLKEIELVKNGKDLKVTKTNIIKYIYLYANYKMNGQIEKQFEAFKNGFNTIFDLKYLRIFSEKELQFLINGTEEKIDIQNLQQNTIYNNYSENEAYIKNFWKIVQSFSDDEKKLFLKFVTNYERPPLFGFKNLQPLFKIDKLSLGEDVLPTSSTCSNCLHLPRYLEKEVLKRKLLQAITLTKGHYIV